MHIKAHASEDIGIKGAKVNDYGYHMYVTRNKIHEFKHTVIITQTRDIQRISTCQSMDLSDIILLGFGTSDILWYIMHIYIHDPFDIVVLQHVILC